MFQVTKPLDSKSKVFKLFLVVVPTGRYALSLPSFSSFQAVCEMKRHKEVPVSSLEIGYPSKVDNGKKRSVQSEMRHMSLMILRFFYH